MHCEGFYSAEVIRTEAGLLRLITLHYTLRVDAAGGAHAHPHLYYGRGYAIDPSRGEHHVRQRLCDGESSALQHLARLIAEGVTLCDAQARPLRVAPAQFDACRSRVATRFSRVEVADGRGELDAAFERRDDERVWYNVRR